MSRQHYQNNLKSRKTVKQNPAADNFSRQPQLRENKNNYYDFNCIKTIKK